MKHIISVCISALLAQLCLAGPISDLAGRAAPGYRPILSGVPLMEVVVISDCENENVALKSQSDISDGGCLNDEKGGLCAGT